MRPPSLGALAMLVLLRLAQQRPEAARCRLLERSLQDGLDAIPPFWVLGEPGLRILRRPKGTVYELVHGAVMAAETALLDHLEAGLQQQHLIGGSWWSRRRSSRRRTGHCDAIP